MLKALGLMGLVTVCGLIGMMKAGELRRRAELLEDFQSMMIEVKGQINYFREPLPDIFIKLGENGESEAFSFLTRAGDMLKEKNGDIAGIWSSQVMKTYEKEPLTEEDLRILRYPGEFVGQTDFDNQIYHFEYFEEKMNRQISGARDDVMKKGPMYAKTGFFAGAVIAIILI